MPPGKPEKQGMREHLIITQVHKGTRWDLSFTRPAFLSFRTKFQVTLGVSQVALVVKNLPVNERDIRDVGSIPGSGRFPGERHSNPVFLPGKSPGERGLVGCSSWGHKESDKTEVT